MEVLLATVLDRGVPTTTDGLTRTPRLLILGGGAVVRELYLPALRELGWDTEALVLDVSDRSLTAIRAAGTHTPVRQGDFRDLLRGELPRQSYDGVVVALPNRWHEEAVLAALRCGLPVLCEKPLGLTGDSCARIGTAAAAAGLPVMVGMVRRLLPSVQAISRAIADGLVGKIVRLDITHGGRFSWPSDSGNYFVSENGGALLNMGIHYLDMAEHWVGPLVPRAYEDDWHGGAEANFSFDLTALDDVPVHIGVSFSHALPNTIVVTGTRGSITARVDEMDRCTWRSQSGLTADLSISAASLPARRPFEFSTAFAEQLVSFSQVIGSARRPDVGPSEAASTHALIDWAMSHRGSADAYPVERPAARPGLATGRAVVTGATGFVGTKLVGRLCELGFDDITAPVRSFQSGAALGCFPVTRRLVDLLRYDDVRAAVDGARYVFHLAYGTSGPGAERVTLEGTKHVVEAAIAAGVESVVVVSTTAVFGHATAEGLVDEQSPYGASLGDYGSSKALAEQYCLSRAVSSPHTRVVVVNPSFVYGPGGWLMVEFPARAARAGQFCWIDEGVGRLNFTFVDNLVDALLLAAASRAAHGQRFIVSDGVCDIRSFLAAILGSAAEGLSSLSSEDVRRLGAADRARWRDLARAMMNQDAKSVARRVPAIRAAKSFLSKHCAPVYERLRAAERARPGSEGAATALSGRQPAVPSWFIDFFGPMKLECSAEKARGVLGWTPLVSLADGQRICRRWLDQLGLSS